MNLWSLCCTCLVYCFCLLFPKYIEWMITLHRQRAVCVSRGSCRRCPWAATWWRQVSSVPLCPTYFIIHCPAYYEQPKDWLAFYLPYPCLPFGLSWLALCWCFTLINEHDVNTYDTMLSLWLWCWTGDTLWGSSGFSSASPQGPVRWTTVRENSATMRVVWDALS